MYFSFHDFREYFCNISINIYLCQVILACAGSLNVTKNIFTLAGLRTTFISWERTLCSHFSISAGLVPLVGVNWSNNLLPFLWGVCEEKKTLLGETDYLPIILILMILNTTCKSELYQIMVVRRHTYENNSNKQIKHFRTLSLHNDFQSKNFIVC